MMSASSKDDDDDDDDEVDEAVLNEILLRDDDDDDDDSSSEAEAEEEELERILNFRNESSDSNEEEDVKSTAQSSSFKHSNQSDTSTRSLLAQSQRLTRRDEIPRTKREKEKRNNHHNEVLDVSRMEKLNRVLTSRRGNSNHSFGIPSVIACGNKFLGVGTDRGIVLLFNYFGELHVVLESSAEGTSSPVTSLAFSVSEESFQVVVSGHRNGHVVLWDTTTGTELKRLLHSECAIRSIRFYRVEEISIVLCDIKGKVTTLTFSKLLFYWSVSEALLFKERGVVFAMDTLLTTTKKKSTKTEVRARSLGLVSLILENITVILSLERLYRGTNDYSLFKLANPDEEDLDSEEQLVCPQLSWGWARTTKTSTEASPILARVWGRTLQLTSVDFPTTSRSSSQEQQHKEETSHFTTVFNLTYTHVSKVPILAVRWIDQIRLAYLTTSHHVVLMDTISKTVLQDVDITLIGGGSTITNSLKKKRGAQNGITSNLADGESVLFVQCRISTQRLRVMGHTEMVERLIEKNDWNGALKLAQKKLKVEICVDLIRRRVRESVGSLKMRYDDVDDVVVHDLASESISFCISIQRCDDVLFREIFTVYEERNKRRDETGERIDFVAIFLESVLPFVKSGRLVKLSAEIMQRFVAHFCDAKRFEEVEACIVRCVYFFPFLFCTHLLTHTHSLFRYDSTRCKWI
jgi:hypothetical protein